MMLMMCRMAGGEAVRWQGRSDSNSNIGGFTWPEMVFLLFVVAVFLVGVVWVVNAAIVKSHPLGKSDTAGRNAERALDRIEALVMTSRVFALDSHPVRAGRWTAGQGILTFLGNLDGDAETGSYSVGDEKGLEHVTIYRQGASLVVSVKSAPAAAPSTVVLLKDLNPLDPEAFTASFRVSASGATKLKVGGNAAASVTIPAMRADETRVSVTTGVGGSRLLLDRSIGLPAEPALATGGSLP